MLILRSKDADKFGTMSVKSNDGCQPNPYSLLIIGMSVLQKNKQSLACFYFS